MPDKYQKWSGTDIPVEAAEDKTIEAAPGVNKTLYVQKGVIAVTLVATGGGGLVSLEDGVGGAKFINIDADALGFYPFDFGEPGFPLTANTLLNATVDGAATNQATATVTVTGIIVF